MMILTQKVTQLAFCVYDGKYNKKKLHNDHAEYAAKTVPSLIEYFGHVFLFTNLLAGPNHRFRDYMNFIRGDGQHGPAPMCVGVAMRKMLFSFLCIAVKFVPSEWNGKQKRRKKE